MIMLSIKKNGGDIVTVVLRKLTVVAAHPMVKR
jgi:hypothetical protein